MDCPVCNSSGVTDESKKCPQCNADLEVFQLTKKIEQSGKNKFLFGLIGTILFLLAVVVLIILFIKAPTTNQKSEQEAQQITQLKSDLAQLKKQNESFLDKNNELTEQLNKKVEDKAKREKIYIVESGETLFTIARKVHGNGYKYTDIAKDNNISDPDILVTGQKLIIYY